MPDELNPYQSPTAKADAEDRPPIWRFWPHRLTLGIFLLGAYVTMALPAVQANRSHDFHERSEAIYSAILLSVPFFVLIPALAVSTLRYPRSNRPARVTAITVLVFFAAFLVWWFWCWTHPV